MKAVISGSSVTLNGSVEGPKLLMIPGGVLTAREEKPNVKGVRGESGRYSGMEIESLNLVPQDTG